MDRLDATDTESSTIIDRRLDRPRKAGRKLADYAKREAKDRADAKRVAIAFP